MSNWIFEHKMKIRSEVLNKIGKEKDYIPKWGIAWFPLGFWWHIWTPSWHNGNGPYVTIGLGIIAIYRGY